MTAFPGYALDAFDVKAIDYLLKPFSDQRFFQALDRAKRRVRECRQATSGQLSDPDGAAEKQFSAPVQTRKEFITQPPIGHGARALSIDVDDVLWIEAEDYYVLVHTRRDRHLLRISMAFLEERLDPRSFVRAHRAAIVNVRAIERVDPEWTSLVLSDGTHVRISRSRRPIVERVITTRISPRG